MHSILCEVVKAEVTKVRKVGQEAPEAGFVLILAKMMDPIVALVPECGPAAAFIAPTTVVDPLWFNQDAPVESESEVHSLSLYESRNCSSSTRRM